VDIPTVQPVFHGCSHNPVLHLRQTVQLAGEHLSAVPLQPKAVDVSERDYLRLRVAGHSPGRYTDQHLFRDSGRTGLSQWPVRAHWKYLEHWKRAFHQYRHHCQFQSCTDELQSQLIVVFVHCTYIVVLLFYCSTL
jgi:hypothetical protein